MMRSKRYGVEIIRAANGTLGEHQSYKVPYLSVTNQQHATQ